PAGTRAWADSSEDERNSRRPPLVEPASGTRPVRKRHRRRFHAARLPRARPAGRAGAARPAAGRRLGRGAARPRPAPLPAPPRPAPPRAAGGVVLPVAEYRDLRGKAYPPPPPPDTVAFPAVLTRGEYALRGACE